MGKVEVDKLGFGLQDFHLALAVIEVELVVEVRGKEVGHASLGTESRRVPLDVELRLPANLLAIVLLDKALRVRELPMHVDTLPLLIHIFALIDCGMLVIDDLQHSVRVLAEVEPLLEVGVNVPLICLQSLIWLPTKQQEEEMELERAL